MTGRSLLRSIRRTLITAAVALLLNLHAPAAGQEAEWIWAPNQPKRGVPPQAVGAFRKVFNLRAKPEQAQIIVTADDAYSLYVNGRQVGGGEMTRTLDQYDVARVLIRGRNTIAIRVTNLRGDTAALAARVLVKLPGQPWTSYSTDRTWKASLRTMPLWNVPFFNDARWPNAQSFGQLGSTPPWDMPEGVAAEESHRGERFKISEEFTVRRVLEGDDIGSLIAMTFNEFGQLIVSQEGGPLLLLLDTNQDGLPDKAQVYCEQLTSCQGLLQLNGELFCTGNGPDGAGLYRASDTDQDGQLDKIDTVLTFKGNAVEHGAHGLTLGPDGYLYVVIGNHASPSKEYSENSPHATLYEGDLMPRYEDPGGHAVGIKAPGGVVIRTDSRGEKVERFAGGLRNAYDLLFNAEGELFVHDSDMESDEATPWYRPTRLYHVPPGGEFGWRSGWAKWPDYFVDNLPPLLDTDRGSPTGGVVYEHFMFPTRYHGALFLADWSEGRILSVRLKANGASYSADSEVFLQGAPLNVCDVDVGPDGSLYFVTGGRGTHGAVYRVTWRGQVPAEMQDLGQGISQAIRQPQLQSAWGRQRIAEIKQELGTDWSRLVQGVAISAANPDMYRLRALDLMQLFGPKPSEQLLLRLAADPSEGVRAKTASLLALQDTDSARKQLEGLLGDSDRRVRRKACEALLRQGHAVPLGKLKSMLASDDRFEAWAARCLLQQQPVQQWRDELLGSKNQRLFIQGALALMTAEPSRENAEAVVERIQQQMGGFISDNNFIDLLRVAQVAVHRGQLPSEGLPEFRSELAREFPAGNPTINRELIRLLVYFQEGSILNRYLEYLQSEAPRIERLHVALHLRFLKQGWIPAQKMELLRFFEESQQMDGPGGRTHYVMNVASDFARSLPPDESIQVVARAAEWPSAALGALFNLPADLGDEDIDQLIEVDRQVADNDDEPSERLRVGLVAVLARSGKPRAMQHLRSSWEREPERRATIAMGLAQSPGGENWPYLMRSIHLVENNAAVEVLTKLRQVERAPAEAEYLRQTIICGLRLKQNGAQQAASLLEFWTGENPAPTDADWEETMTQWQSWFANRYPMKPPAELPVAEEGSRWQLEELQEFLDSDEGRQGDQERGREVFAKAQCIKCHRFGGVGEPMGPDLTSVNKRFTRREILESILFPSHVISDQYAAKTVLTDDGRRFTGMVAQAAQGQLSILQANGEKVRVDQSSVERMRRSPVSAMPVGLLNEVTLQEIADLFAYLGVSAPAVARRDDDE